MTKTVLIIIIICLMVQQVLVLPLLIKLFSGKPKYLNKLVWNFILILVVFIGPIVYIIIEKPFKKKSSQNQE